MAYAAAISLKNTIHHFLNSSSISLVPKSRAIVELTDAEATSLQQVLKRQDERGGNKKLDALDGRIREALHKIEDVLEFHVSNHYFSSNNGGHVEGSSSRALISLDEVEVEELVSLSKLVKKMKEDYIQELEKVDEEDDDDDGDAWTSSSIDFGVEMVGLSDEYAEIMEGLLKRSRPDDFVVYPILGMAGTGRTVVAKSVFDDLGPLFDCAAWVTVGRECQFKQLLRRILAQTDGELHTSSCGENDLVKHLYTRLEGRRYMIVLDDMWDGNILDELLRSCFPEQDNGSVVMYTSSLKELPEARPNGFHRYVMSIHNDYNIRDLLRPVIGCLAPCPPEHEEAALKIAMNVQGCVIPMVKAFHSLIMNADKSLPYLRQLAADHNNPMFLVHDELSEVSKIEQEMQQLYNFVMDEDKECIACFIDLIDFSQEIEEIKTTLFPKRFISKLEIISFYGMAGIGKSALVKKIFADTSFFHDIDHRAWITLGPKYRPEKILVDILAQIYPDIDKRQMTEDAGLVEVLCAKLSLKKCLIALDDVWSQEPVHYLKKLFPAIKGKLLLTTRLEKVAQFEQSDKVHEVRLLNLEESWSLFCRKVFVDGLCPPKLEIVGKKISENCEGLPLLILTVADLLSKAERTPEFWNKVADKKNSLFTDAQKKISKILLPSYKTLPQYLKPFFLYMGVFPQSYQIPISKLNHLLKAERFLEQNSCQNIEDFVAECLSELANRSLLMVCQMGSNFRVKTYRLHSVFWYLSSSEASKSMLFQVLNTYTDHSIEDIKGHRRLCIHKSVLLSIKDVCNSIASLSSAHSLLCNGPPHKYEVPIYFGLTLLRVMDALSIRLYEFPIELVKLIHLRYLALTCNGNLPASISELWSLHYLIVGQHLSINSSKDSLYLPVEIWDMKELRHLQIMGGCLPNPNGGARLPNLVTLLDVSAQSCTKRVLKRIPNVKKLGIQIELSPGSDANPFHCLNRIWRLRKLESLKCVVVNPELRSKIATPPAPHSMFPSSLKKLSLSGLGYPWGYMNIIGELRNLEVLKLRCFAFQGPKWESTSYDHLENLKYLSIDDSDLEHWGVTYGTLTFLRHLSFKHCYKLKSLPDTIPSSTRKLEIVDCNPFVGTWAKKMQELFSVDPVVYSKLLQVQSSWEDHRFKH